MTGVPRRGRIAPRVDNGDTKTTRVGDLPDHRRTYTGTPKVTGATAAYRKVRGSGTVTGTNPDAVTTTLAYKLKLTGVPKGD